MNLKRILLFIVLLLNLFQLHISNTNLTSPQISKPIYNKEKPFEYGFYSSLLQSFILIFISEIGDNTFILCLLFSREFSKLCIFSIASASLLMMNIFSIFLGSCVIYFVYKSIVNWFAFLIFLIYGIWLLDESRRIDQFDNEEAQDVEDQNAITKLGEDVKKVSAEFMSYYTRSKKKYNTTSPKSSFILSIPDYTPPPENDKKEEEILHIKTSEETYLQSEQQKEEHSQNQNIFWTFFTSILFGEFGDRSQIVTIVVTSIFNTYGVILGTSLAYLSSVIFAVYFGKIITKNISEKMITITSGLLLIIISINIFLFKVK